MSRGAVNRDILIVDDEPHAARVLDLALRRAGHTVRIAPNGVRALAAIDERHPDVMITDVQMPQMGGRELCERIAADLPQRAFPILVLTSRPEHDHRNWTAAMHDVFFMEKPASIRRILGWLDDPGEALRLAANGGTA